MLAGGSQRNPDQSSSFMKSERYKSIPHFQKERNKLPSASSLVGVESTPGGMERSWRVRAQVWKLAWGLHFLLCVPPQCPTIVLRILKFLDFYLTFKF